MPYAKNTIKVKVPQKSGFDKSHRNSGTLTCGTLTPLLCDEVVPNSRVSLRLNLAAQLPPLVSDTYMNCKLKAEAFFVPMRLLCKSFESWFCDVPERRYNELNFEWVEEKGALPHFILSCPDGTGPLDSIYFGAGSLADYIGLKLDSMVSGNNVVISALPFVAYHLIWQEWYRNPRVQNPAFAPVNPFRSPDSDPDLRPRVFDMPYKFFNQGASHILVDAQDINSGNFETNLELCDGTSIFALRQRNFGQDYFSGSRLDAQQGSPAAVSVVYNEETETNTFTIAALRAANSLQQFRERNNIPSPRLVDQVKARYNANLSDGVAQRPICIGSASYDLSTRGVDQTAPATDTEGANPFSAVGAQYGRAYGAGSDFIISDFTANEPGYIMVLVSVVPEVTYSSGILPMFTRYASEGSVVNMANPLLQNVGDQPIRVQELVSVIGNNRNNVFGYQDRYADFMYMPNSAHGLFRTGENLSSFVLQRKFVDSASLNSAFLEIPKNFLDGVLQVSSETSGLCAWYDCMLDYRVSMPLAEWSLPSLQNPAYEHGDTINLRRNGQIF